MMWIRPGRVRLGDAELSEVLSVAVDREASREVVEFSDAGPHAVFVDVPERVTRVTVTRRVSGDLGWSPEPGWEGLLEVESGANRSGAGVRLLSALVVVRGVSHRLSSGRESMQTIGLVAVSSDGVSSPVTVTGVGVLPVAVGESEK